MNKGTYYKEGIQAGIPIALGYFAVSFAFGILALNKGLSVWEAVIISLSNLTSAGQFAGLQIIAASGSLLELSLSQLVINLRYCLMSFSLSQKLRKDEPFYHRFLIGFAVTDEIFGVSALYPGKSSAYFHYGAMSMAIPGWVFGTLCGALLGDVLPSLVCDVLSVSLYGMFIAIIIPPCKGDRILTLVVAASMFMSSLFFVIPFLKDISSGFVVIIVTLSVSLLAALFCPREEADD